MLTCHSIQMLSQSTWPLLFLRWLRAEVGTGLNWKREGGAQLGMRLRGSGAEGGFQERLQKSGCRRLDKPLESNFWRVQTVGGFGAVGRAAAATPPSMRPLFFYASISVIAKEPGGKMTRRARSGTTACKPRLRARSPGTMRGGRARSLDKRSPLGPAFWADSGMHLQCGPKGSVTCRSHTRPTGTCPAPTAARAATTRPRPHARTRHPRSSEMHTPHSHAHTATAASPSHSNLSAPPPPSHAELSLGCLTPPPPRFTGLQRSSLPLLFDVLCV